MTPEIEAKFLDIDHAKFRAKLRELGAVRTKKPTLMTRAVFEDATGEMTARGGWAHVRDEGNQITMSYKQTNNFSLTGTSEICLKVDNFANAVEFLKNIGLKQKSFQETRRESWTLDGAEIDLDEWPWLPSFIEIEAPDEKIFASVAKKLGLNLANSLSAAVDRVYAKYYDVDFAEVNSWPEIKFTKNVPEWLAKKRRIAPEKRENNLVKTCESDSRKNSGGERGRK